MVNTKFNGIRPVAPANALADESTMRGRGGGRGRRRARGIVRGRVASAGDETHVKNARTMRNLLYLMKI